MNLPELVTLTGGKLLSLNDSLQVCSPEDQRLPVSSKTSVPPEAASVNVTLAPGAGLPSSERAIVLVLIFVAPSLNNQFRTTWSRLTSSWGDVRIASAGPPTLLTRMRLSM